MLDSDPAIVVVAGPNGAGKTTAAPFLLRDALGVREYVNADPIAAGLSAFAPESVGVAAGRVMLARINDLARQRISFGFETTLASRSFAPWLKRRLADGYAVQPGVPLARQSGAGDRSCGSPRRNGWTLCAGRGRPTAVRGWAPQL